VVVLATLDGINKMQCPALDIMSNYLAL